MTYNYLCTYDLYSLVYNVLDARISITRGSGTGLGPGILEFFWALWNGIEPIGECHLRMRYPIRPIQIKKFSSPDLLVYSSVVNVYFLWTKMSKMEATTQYFGFY